MKKDNLCCKLTFLFGLSNLIPMYQLGFNWKQHINTFKGNFHNDFEQFCIKN